VLAYKDTDGNPLVDKIIDTAGQKGTGKWTGKKFADSLRHVPCNSDYNSKESL